MLISWSTTSAKLCGFRSLRAFLDFYGCDTQSKIKLNFLFQNNLKLLNFHRPDLPRPIKVNILIPIVFLVICLALVLIPSFYEPQNLGINILITLSGIPFYYLCVKWKNKPKQYEVASKSVEKFCQILFQSVFMDEQA